MTQTKIEIAIRLDVAKTILAIGASLALVAASSPARRAPAALRVQDPVAALLRSDAIVGAPMDDCSHLGRSAQASDRAGGRFVRLAGATWESLAHVGWDAVSYRNLACARGARASRRGSLCAPRDNGGRVACGHTGSGGSRRRSLVARRLAGRAFRDRAAAERERQSQGAAATLAREQREADLQRERLSELRPVIDDAAHAMSDLWRVLGTIIVAHSRLKYNKPELHMTEERGPSVAEFLDAYERLRDAHDRLLLRVQWDDTLHAPVGRALVAAQGAWTAVTKEAEHLPLSDEADRKIGFANGEVQIGYRELQETASERFAPDGLAGSQRAVVLILRLRQPPRGPIRNTNPQAERFLGPLRLARHARVVGPDKDGRVVVRAAESEPGDARARLEADLDDIGSDWRQALELDPPPNPPAG